MNKKYILATTVICAAMLFAGSLILPEVMSGLDAAEPFDPNQCPVFVDSHAAAALSRRSEKLKRKLNFDNYCTLTIDENGRIDFYNGNYTFTSAEPFAISDKEAVSQAKEILSELGLLPGGGYRTRVSRVTTSSLDLNGGQNDSFITTECIVSFYRVCNGVDAVSDLEDGIMLSFGKSGVHSLQYFWRDMEIRRLDTDGKVPLTAEQAYQIYIDQWDERHGTCCDPCSEPVIKQAYYQSGNTTRPCWVISEDDEYLNAWWIDMYSGQIYPS